MTICSPSSSALLSKWVSSKKACSFKDSIVVDGNWNNGIQYFPMYLRLSNVSGEYLKAELLQSALARMLGSSLTYMRAAIHR